MYISPLILLELMAPGVLSAFGPGDADDVDLIGGTSTCWIPFFAWICALILAAAAARDGQLVGRSYEAPFRGINTYLQQLPGRQDSS